MSYKVKSVVLVGESVDGGPLVTAAYELPNGHIRVHHYKDEGGRVSEFTTLASFKQYVAAANDLLAKLK